MAWTKIPTEHHEIFFDALPADPRFETIKMFGGICVTVNGNMAGGLWAETVVVRLDKDEQDAVLAMEGGEQFDPMGKGRPMKDMVLLPRDFMEEPQQLTSWLAKAIDFTDTLPPKPKKKKTAKKKTTKKKTTKKKTTKKKTTKKKTTKKKTAKKKTAKKR